MKADSNVTRRIDQMLLLLGRRPKLPLSAANVFLVSCANPRQVSTSNVLRLPHETTMIAVQKISSTVLEANTVVAVTI